MAMTGMGTIVMVSTATALTERVTTSGATTEKGLISRVTGTRTSIGTVSMKKVSYITSLQISPQILCMCLDACMCEHHHQC